MNRCGDIAGLCAGFSALLLVLFGSVDGQAQNLLVNGGFDGETLSPWQVVGPSVAVWSDLDYAADENSGSARLINNGAAAGTHDYVLRQCIVLDRPGRVFRLGAAAFIQSGQVAGDVGATLRYGSSLCGETTSGEGFFIAAAGAWQVREYTFVLPATLPAGDVVEVWLYVYKDGAGGSFAGHMDNVRLENDGVFADGFEPLP